MSLTSASLDLILACRRSVPLGALPAHVGSAEGVAVSQTESECFRLPRPARLRFQPPDQRAEREGLYPSQTPDLCNYPSHYAERENARIYSKVRSTCPNRAKIADMEHDPNTPQSLVDEYNKRINDEVARLEAYRTSLQQEYEQRVIDEKDTRYRAMRNFSDSIHDVSTRIIEIALERDTDK